MPKFVRPGVATVVVLYTAALESGKGTLLTVITLTAPELDIDICFIGSRMYFMSYDMEA